MMAEKARLFGDEEACRSVFRSTDPAAAKELGRRVRGFDDELWATKRWQIVIRGNLAKFRQPTLRTFLLGTGEAVLVEASPVDRVWGIGLSANQPDAQIPSRWPGLNLLGFALMTVRYQLRGEKPEA